MPEETPVAATETPAVALVETPSRPDSDTMLDNLMLNEDNLEQGKEAATQQPTSTSPEKASPSVADTSAAAKEPTDTPSTPVPAPVPDKLAEAIDKLSQRLEQPVKEEAPPATPPPAFKFHEVSTEEADALIEGGEKAQGVLNTIYKKAVEDSLKLSLALMNQIAQPLQQFVQEQAAERDVKEYLDKYPNHKDWIDEAKQMANQILSDGSKKFKNKDEVFKAVGDAVEAHIAKYKGRFGVTGVVPAAPEAGRIPPPKVAPSGARPKGGNGLTDEQNMMKDIMEMS